MAVISDGNGYGLEDKACLCFPQNAFVSRMFSSCLCAMELHCWKATPHSLSLVGCPFFPCEADDVALLNAGPSAPKIDIIRMLVDVERRSPIIRITAGVLEFLRAPSFFRVLKHQKYSIGES